ncbi:hypothetical protein FB446DRAFT_755035 [Lentinula raphanica]|nr:hypothetical protein FB446DRAFT_755035 [Lentinula raphanica]
MRTYVSFFYSTSRWSVRRNLVYDNQNILRWHTHRTYNSIFPLAMRLLHHTKSKVALLVCLFLLVVTAAPAPPSPSVDLAVPPVGSTLSLDMRVYHSAFLACVLARFFSKTHRHICSSS